MLPFCTVTDDTVRDVAKNKPALQVSEYSDQQPASSANDGNEHTCAASKLETNPWWSVDLGVPTLVFMVKLTNERDDKGICTAFHQVTLWLVYWLHAHLQGSFSDNA